MMFKYKLSSVIAAAMIAATGGSPVIATTATGPKVSVDNNDSNNRPDDAQLIAGLLIGLGLVKTLMNKEEEEAKKATSWATRKITVGTSHSYFDCSTWVEPGVFFQAEPKSVSGGDEYFQYEVYGTTTLLCADWDWPDIGHRSNCMTIDNISQVRSILMGVGGTWRMYATPGGVRAFLISERVAIKDLQEGKAFFKFEDLNADPLYWRFCQSCKQYRFRVVPKATRKDYDWVAEFLEVVGNPTDADPELTRLVETYHDQQVVINRGYAELNKEQWDMINSHR
jgi:hypothetical protein